MSQTLAIFVDAYRELNARKMFWVTLILSGLLFAVLALFGADDNNLTFLAWSWKMPGARAFYKYVMLDMVLVGAWLSWGAVILALLSTAGIFPDFVSNGTIDLYLSKPIGRLRLFLTKYAAGLLFVVLQSAVFAVCAFLVVGARLGDWRPGLFLTVPLLTAMFSYLYAVSVLFGVWTRSTIAALSLTLVVWLVVFAVNFAENLLHTQVLEVQAMAEVETRRSERLDARLQAMAAAPGGDPATGGPAAPAARDAASGDAETSSAEASPEAGSPPSGREGSRQPSTGSNGRPRATREQVRSARDAAKANVAEARADEASWSPWHKGLWVVKTMSPKTSDTIGLMDRALYTDEEWERKEQEMGGGRRRGGYESNSSDADVDNYSQYGEASALARERMSRQKESRSVGWVVGTSLIFEAAMLGLAAWIFCRRDY